MEQTTRNKRLHLLVKKHNKERKKQAQKIDILCNDIIAAQRNFIKQLSTVAFAAEFYNAIIATTTLENLFDIAAANIKQQIADANIAFFLRHPDNFELHSFKSEHLVTLRKHPLEDSLNPQLVENICRSNKVCTLQDLLEMGLNEKPSVLKKISATTIPLGRFGSSTGFILICRPSENQLTAEQISLISAITPGLSKAINTRQALASATS